jgi:hypothetical protein
MFFSNVLNETLFCSPGHSVHPIANLFATKTVNHTVKKYKTEIGIMQKIFSIGKLQ